MLLNILLIFYFFTFSFLVQFISLSQVVNFLLDNTNGYGCMNNKQFWGGGEFLYLKRLSV